MSDDHSLNILLKPHSNKNNKKILDYLNAHQKKINSNDIIIKPLIMNPDKIDDFVKIGVSNLPSLLYNGKIVYGVNEIIKYINQLCTKVEKEPRKKNDDESDIREYMISAAFEEDEGEMERPISDKEIRNNRFSKHNKKNTNNDYDSKAGSDDEEEDIMNKYWQNSEETDV